MKVKYQGEAWRVYDDCGNDEYYLAKRVNPKYIDFDTTTCEPIPIDKEEYIPKKKCEVLG